VLYNDANAIPLFLILFCFHYFYNIFLYNIFIIIISCHFQSKLEDAVASRLEESYKNSSPYDIFSQVFGKIVMATHMKNGFVPSDL